MIELFNKIKSITLDEAVEICVDYEGNVKIDIDYSMRTIILSINNVSIKVDYDFAGKPLASYSTENIEGAEKVEI